MLGEKLEVAVHPQHLAVEIQRGDDAPAKDGEDALAVGDRSRRSIGVVLALLQRLLIEDMRVPKNLAGLRVHRKHMARPALLGCRAQEYAVFPKDRRRPASAGNSSFPGDVLAGPPFEGRVLFRGHPLTARAAKTRPIFAMRHGGETQDNGKRGNRSPHPARISSRPPPERPS